MNAIILNGGGTAAPYGEIARRAAARLEQRGAAVSAFDLTGMDIAPCRGCFRCWTETPGLCYRRDAMDAIMPRLARSEAVVWITPIAYGGAGYHLKKALDRSIPVLLPFFTRIDGETHHPTRYDWKPRIAAVGVLPDPDPAAEEIFRGLIVRNAINMHARARTVIVRGLPEAGGLEAELDFLSTGEAATEVRP